MNRMKLLASTALLLLTPTMAFADNHIRWGNWGYGNGPRWSNSQNCNNGDRYGNSGWNHYRNSGYSNGYSNGYGNGYNNGYYNNGNRGFGQSRDADEIRYGIRSGQLSNREVRELADRRRQIEMEAASYRADGRLTPRERNEIREDYRDYREKLDHELNDGERRNRRY